MRTCKTRVISDGEFGTCSHPNYIIVVGLRDLVYIQKKKNTKRLDQNNIDRISVVK